MLKRIEIENFLTIEKAVIEPADKITAIVGESGSGKSLILRTVDNLFSLKTDTSFIGSFSDISKIGLLFKLNEEQKNNLEQFGIMDDEIFITKIIKKGKARAYINYEPISQRVLSELKNVLIDLVSQDYRFELFSNNRLLEVIDRMINRNTLYEFHKSYKEFVILKRHHREIEDELDRIIKSHPDVLLEAIEKASPKENEYESLLNLSKQVKLSVMSKDVVSYIVSVLFEGDNSVEGVLSLAIAKLEKLIERGMRFESLDLLKGSLEKINMTKDELYGVLNKTFDQKEVDEINKRLFELEELQRQFGMELNDIIKKKEELQKLVKKREKLEDKLKVLEDRLKDSFEVLKGNAEKLSKERKRAALIIQGKIEKELKNLKLERSVVKLVVEDKNIDQTGKDKITVLFTANPDLKVQPLEKVASGGEKSRFILALKKATSSIMRTCETVFFDEIEIGLSDTVLESVLNSLKEYSESTQIILITHNPSVRDIAEKVYRVDKVFDNKKTKSVIG